MFPRPLSLALMVLFALLARAAPLFAQDDWSQPWADPQDRPARVDVSASAGFLLPTRWSDLVLLGSISPASGVLEQVLTRDLRVEPKAEFNVGMTYWRDRYGVRTQLGFSRSSLTISGVPSSTNPPPVTNGATSVDIDTWLYDVRGAIGFLDYKPTRPVWPYGFFGFGGITYNPKGTISAPLTFIQQGPSGPTAPDNTVVVLDNGRQFLIAVDQLGIETVFAFNVGLGADFRVPVGGGGVGLRLEVSDHVAPSPLGLRVKELSPISGLLPDAGVRFGLVHHLSATAGFVIQIGK